MTRILPELHRCHLCRTVFTLDPVFADAGEPPAPPCECPACSAPVKRRQHRQALAGDLISAWFKNTRGLERDPPSVREVFVRGCWDEREVAPLLRAVRRYDFDAHEAMVLRMQAALGPSPDWTTILRANREARAARQSGELLRALEAEGVAAREVLRAERERCFRVLTERQRAARIEGAETPPRGGPERRKSPGPGGST